MKDSGREDFYVGYLPMPRAHRIFLRWVAPGILWTMVLICGCTLWLMEPPGPARWETGRLLGVNGTVRREPYPMVEVRAPDGRIETLLLTGVGKRGAAIADLFVDRRCIVRGYPLEREGRRILELMDGHEAMIRSGEPEDAWTAPPLEDLGPVTFRGEILDSKCWHGAMKPGEGRAHKACATLCVRGGIPPLLITRDPAGGPSQTFLLTSAAGGSAAEDVLPFLGEAVEVRGALRRRADLLWLALDPGGVRPEREVRIALECRILLPGPGAGAQSFIMDGVERWATPVERFDLAYVGPTPDLFGMRAIAFELTAEDKARFEEYTGRHVNRQMAVGIAGHVFGAPNINEALPGAGILLGGPQGFSEAEQRRWIEFVRAELRRQEAR